MIFLRWRFVFLPLSTLGETSRIRVVNVWLEFTVAFIIVMLTVRFAEFAIVPRYSITSTERLIMVAYDALLIVPLCLHSTLIARKHAAQEAFLVNNLLANNLLIVLHDPDRHNAAF